MDEVRATVVKNEKGSLFVYTIFLILLLSVLSIPLLNITSAKDIANYHDHNQKVANNLVLSIAEDYLAFLSPCIGYIAPDADDEEYEYSEIDILCGNPDYYRGFALVDEPSSFTLPDGTVVSYSVRIEQDSSNNDELILFKVVAGDTDRNHQANEKFAHEQMIKYSLHGIIVKDDTPSGSAIDPNNRVTPIPNNIYFGLEPTYNKVRDPGSHGTSNDSPLGKWYKSLSSHFGSELKIDLPSYLTALSNIVPNPELQPQAPPQYDGHSNIRTCSQPCSKTTILSLISNNSDKNPLIIKASAINFDLSENLILGNSNQKIILMADTMEINRENKLTLHGDIIVKNKISSWGGPKIELHGDLFATEMSAGSAILLNEGISPPPTNNIWVAGKLDIPTNSRLNVKNTIYAGEFKINTGSKVTATDIIVKGTLDSNPDSIFEASNLFYTGVFDGNTNNKVTATDIVVKGKLTAGSGSSFDALNTLYAGTYYGTSNNKVTATDIIVKGELSGSGNTINAKKQIVAGSVNVQAVTTFMSQEGDFFVVNDFKSTNPDHFKVGGSIAIGGTLTMSNPPSSFSIGYQFNPDGTLKRDSNGNPIPGTSVLDPALINGSGGGGGTGGSGGSGGTGADKTVWRPVRTK